MRTNFKLIFCLMALFVFAYACTDVDDLRAAYDNSTGEEEVEDEDTDEEEDDEEDLQPEVELEDVTSRIVILSQMSADSYPSDVDTWVFTEPEADHTDDFAGLREALYAASSEKRKIELVFKNLTAFPQSALYLGRTTLLTAITAVSAPEVISVDSAAFFYATGLKTIDMPKLESVGSSAFERCTSLASVSLPVLKSVDYKGFRMCTNTTLFDLPALTTAGDSAFCDCYAITSVSFPELTYCGTDCFDNCKSIIRVNLPKLAETGRTSFNNLVALKSITLGLTEISDTSNGVMFSSCPLLEKVEFPYATIVGENAFQNFQYLKEIIIPSVKTVGRGAFMSCNALEEITLSNVESILRWTFRECNNLKVINLPIATTIGKEAFANCNSIEELNIATDAGVMIKSIDKNAFINEVINTDAPYTDLSKIALSIGGSNELMVDGETFAPTVVDESNAVIDGVTFGPFKSISIVK